MQNMKISDFIDMQNIQVIKYDNKNIYVVKMLESFEVSKMFQVYNTLKSNLPNGDNLIFIPSMMRLETMSLDKLKQIRQVIDNFINKRESKGE